jgi:hypothetical protein
LIEIVTLASVEVLAMACLSVCKSLSSVGFEAESRLSRIEGPPLRKTGLVEISVPSLIQLWISIAFLNPDHCP